MAEHLFEAIGTHWKIAINDALTHKDEEMLLAQIRARIDEFDRDYSRFRADSLITRMSQEAGEYALPADAEPMLDLYRDLYALTGGLVTPLIGDVLIAAGYDAQYSLQPREMRPPPAWDEALEYRFPRLVMRQPAMLDFGAAGKGYLVDLIADLLKAVGVRSFLINAGGDLCVYDERGIAARIGLEHPEDPSLAIGVAEIHNRSICGSAGNRRAWGQFHHIINPHTLSPVRDTLAVWTVAGTTMLADALATCLFFVAPSVLSRYPFEWLMMDRSGAIERSEHFPAELFLA
jgi:thiamine biosynthesis lipoprotein